MNRAQRRKVAGRIATAVSKNRDLAMKKKQWGLGLIVTNLMLAVIFGPWTWTLIDRRLS